MAKYRYTAKNRSALRAAVTSSPYWLGYRKTHNLSSASLDIETLESVAIAVGIDPAMYGTSKSAKRDSKKGAPKAFDADAAAAQLASLLARIDRFTKSVHEIRSNLAR